MCKNIREENLDSDSPGHDLRKDEIPDRFGNSLCIISAVPVEFFLGAMFHKLIGNPQADYFGFVAIVVHILNHSTSKTSNDGGILQSDDLIEPGKNSLQEFIINGFKETHVVMSHTDLLLLQHPYGAGGFMTYGAKGENGNVISIFKLLSLSNLNFAEGLLQSTITPFPLG